MSSGVDDRTTQFDLKPAVNNEAATRRVRTILSVIETDDLVCVPVIWRGVPDSNEFILGKSF